jgi:nucleoside-diphosphate-sugar epimerase
MKTFDSVYQGKKVLVTGGAGFIGSNLVRKLVDLGANVTVVDSLIPDYGGNLYNLDGYESHVKLNIADVRDPYSMNFLVQNQDFLFNCAGQISHIDSMENPYTDLEINVRAQLSILEACRHYNPRIRILFASTRQIYGKPLYLPVDENHPINPTDVNGINKSASEQYHLLYCSVYNIPVTILRLTNVYGPRMRIKDARQTFIGWWFRQIIEDQPIKIYGDGQQLRDLNYIDDVVNAMLLASASPDSIGGIYNLGNIPVSLLSLAQELVKQNGSGKYELIEFPAERKKIDIGSYFADYSKICREIGWQPSTSLARGLCESLDFYRENLVRYL